MGLFKKKTDYSYYSSYSRSKRRLRVGRTAIAIIAAVVVIVGLIVYLNFNAWKNPYTFLLIFRLLLIGFHATHFFTSIAN